MLSRADRVKRGLQRIALVGLCFGLAGAGWWVLQWRSAAKADLFVTAAGKYFVLKDIGDDDALRTEIVKEIGAAITFDDLVPGGGRKAFQAEIEKARTEKLSDISDRLGIAIGFAAGGALWCASVLLLSWLIRGFMM